MAQAQYDTWLSQDPTLSERIERARIRFTKSFDTLPSVVVIAPGRAEILGNHTDYNGGRTLSANIRNNLIVVGSKRQDTKVQLLSVSQTKEKEIFDLEMFNRSYNLMWKNYVKGVIREVGYSHPKLSHGFNALIESSIPMGGGVSSSAALELAFVHLFESLYDYSFSPMEKIRLAKAAENNYVGSPCGFLDQGTIELANSSWLMMDYKTNPKTNAPITYEEIKDQMQETTLVIGYDPETKRQLTEGKYASRRGCCESIVKLWNEVTGENINTMCDISFDTYKVHEQNLQRILAQKIKQGLYRDFLKMANLAGDPEKQAQVMLEWAGHPVAENDRVTAAIQAIKKKDSQTLGDIFSDSGKSGVYMFDASEGAPELEWVYETVEKNKKSWGVLGIRNMGGGFNATTLALVNTKSVDIYKEKLNQEYKAKFGTEYLFIDFTPSPNIGVKML